MWMFAALALSVHRVAYAAGILKPEDGSSPSSGTGCVAGSNKICNPLKVDSIEGLIEVIINLALRIGIPIAALMIIYSGFLFVTARGDVKQIETAKNNFFWTVIGTGILLGAFAIVQLLQGTIDSLGV